MNGLRVGVCLSLSGRFGRFGSQAAAGLQAWQALAGDGVRLRIEDDASDPARVARQLDALAAHQDLLLGPYSTQLMRTAGEVLAGLPDGLVFNHGGAGDDVQRACPGRIVSVLAPTSRYAVPFVAARAGAGVPLWVLRGPGQFARQVTTGALAAAARLGVAATEIEAPSRFEAAPARWDLFSAGRFEDDVEAVARALKAPHPPRAICSIAAGVRDFATVVDDPDGIYGIAQWTASDAPVVTGPDQSSFIDAYRREIGADPDYPAVQAAATAAIAVECARIAGSTDPRELWAAATALCTATLLGAFGVDARTGVQTQLEPVLVRWRGRELVAARSSLAR